MIKVLMDISTLLNAVTGNNEDLPDSHSIFKLCASGKIQGWLGADALLELGVLLKEQMADNEYPGTMAKITDAVAIAPVRKKIVLDALEMPGPDPRRNMQMVFARELGLDFILTEAKGSFVKAPVPAITPTELLEQWRTPQSFEKKRTIPFVDLKAQFSLVYNEIDQQLSDVIKNTAFIRGPRVKTFEDNFAAYCNARYCTGLGNGTDALFVALKAMGIGPGDEVIVPANTFIATPEAVSMAGARVVFVDCDAETKNINPNLIEQQITSKTKAIIPVHLYGHPADMPEIYDIAKNHGLRIIQDCAQAHGATIDGKPLMSFGDVLCFSFYPGKNLGAYGDAGAVVTNDDAIAEKILMFANHGRIGKYNHEFEGINSRMDGFQGAVLNVKLKYLAQWTRCRIKNASLYDQFLKNEHHIKLPTTSSNMKHVYHLYVIQSRQRDELQKYLKENGIATGIHYPIALPNLDAYRYLGHNADDFPVSNQFQNEILSIPMYPELSEDMLAYVSEKIISFFKN